MIEVYRFHKSKYPGNSGKGAAIYGGRWNAPGIEAVYAAQSRSLGALEILVHYAVLPREFVVTPIRIPDRVIAKRSWISNHKNKQVDLPYGVTQKVAAEWFPKTALLDVPSAIIPQERIYVLNPLHPDFQYIQFLDPEPFSFDPRLRTDPTSTH